MYFYSPYFTLQTFFLQFEKYDLDRDLHLFAACSHIEHRKEKWLEHKIIINKEKTENIIEKILLTTSTCYKGGHVV